MNEEHTRSIMKRIIRSTLAFGLPLLALTACAKDLADSSGQSLALAGSHSASGLNSKIVSSDAQWLMHLDLNALRDSTVGKELVTQAIAFQAMAMQGQKFPIQIDIPKLLETIGSITAYGTNLSQDPNLVDGALVFQGTPDLRKIAEGAVAQATVTTPEHITELKDMPFEAYSIGGQLIVAFPKEPIILLSKSKAQLLSAHKVFRGDSPSLAKAKDSPLTGLVRNQTGAFVLAASVVPSGEFFPQDAPQARILQMAKSASVELGEVNKQTFAHVQLLAASDESADKLMKILQGITAMISLAESSDQYLSEFLKSVAVSREKNTVTLHLAYSSERLIQMLNEVKKAHSEERRPSPSRPKPPKIEGTIVGTWVADQQMGTETVSPQGLVAKTFENVALSSGSLIILTGERESGENARIDRVELSPAGGGQPLRFEAEHMNLKGYEVETNAAASGGKLIKAQAQRATARFQFPGADGSYTLTVRYCDENDGKSSYTVSVKNPDPVEGEAH